MKTARTQAPPRRTAVPSEPEPGVSLRVAAAIYFGLAALYFFPAFLPDRHIYGTDYLVGSFFMHEFISQRFAAGELPKWVPHIYGGVPIFANPGSTFYPFRFLVDAIFPVSMIFPALFVIQFGIAGLGTYLLARELRIRSWVALIAGLAFQFTGITMSWVLAGHDGRIIVATFAPLTFYFVHHGVRTGRVAPFVGMAAAIGFSLLSFQIQNSYYLLLGTLVWGVFCLWHLGAFAARPKLARVLGLTAGALVFAFLMAAVNFIPFMDYIGQSPRGMTGGRGYEYSTSFSMPAAEVLALAVPEMAGYLETYRGTNPMKLHTEYVGAVVVVLVALGFAYARRDRYWRLFLGLGVFFLTIALGGSTPLYRLWYEILPGTKRFRAPSVSMFMVSLALVMIAALALEHVAARREERRASRAVRAEGDGAGAAWILAGVVGLGVVLGMAAQAGSLPQGVAGPGAASFRFALFAAAVAAVVWYWMQGTLGVRWTFLLLSALTVVDLWVVDRKFFETVPPAEAMFAPDDVAEFLRSRPGRDRSWVLPFPQGAVYRGQPGNYLMRFDLDVAGGEHGNQLQRYNEYVGAGTQVYTDYHNLLGAPAFMAAGNVRYLITGTEFQDPRLREVHRGSALVYENVTALPRAYLVGSVETTAQPDRALARIGAQGFDPRTTAVVNAEQPVRLPAGPLQGTASITSYTPDRVAVRTQASRQALLVLADNYYADWRATVDGREAPILRTNHTFRGVVVGPGRHEVVFTFEPRAMYRGFYIFAACMAALALFAVYLAVRAFRGRRRETDPAPA
jgi:hypothetical protein